MNMITDAAIRAAISRVRAGGAARIELKDGGERGGGRLMLTLRVATDHVIAEWYARWHREGKPQSTKLGTYPALSLAGARKSFRERYTPAILEGKNPTGPRAWTKSRGATIRDLFISYTEHMEGAGSTKGSIRGAKYCLLGPTGLANALGPGRPASSIATSDIVEVLVPIHRRGAVHQASSVRAWAHAAFQHGITSANCYHKQAGGTHWGLASNPVTPIAKDPAASIPGDRHLSEEEFRALWNWLTEKGASYRYRFAPAIQLMMATGQRPSEILKLGLQNYDPTAGELFWQTTKNKRPHCIPLPRQAICILDATIANEFGHFFYAQRRPHLHADSNVNEWVVARYLLETGARAFVTRDLRRTWKTLAGAAGLSKEIRDRLQNHALSDLSSKHYDRYDYREEKRKAIKVWERYLTIILTGDPEGSVEFARPVRITKPKIAAALPQALI